MNTVRDLKEALRDVPDEYIVPWFKRLRIVAPEGTDEGYTMWAVYPK